MRQVSLPNLKKNKIKNLEKETGGLSIDTIMLYLCLNINFK